MPFEKGVSGNPSGRKKGSSNKTTEALRSAVQDFIEKNWHSIQVDFDLMRPSERLAFITSLLKYVLPPPLTPEALTEKQLSDLMEYIKNSVSDEET